MMTDDLLSITRARVAARRRFDGHAKVVTLPIEPDAVNRAGCSGAASNGLYRLPWAKSVTRATPEGV